MATFTGTLTSTSRQGTGGSQTRSITVRSDGPPPEERTFSCDEQYFGDAREAGGKAVTVTYDETATPPQNVDGLKVHHA